MSVVFIAHLDQQFRKPAERKVRAMLLSNQFAPALVSSRARIVLPGYDPGTSRYEWSFWGYHPGETPGGIIAEGRTGGTNGPLPAPAMWKWPGYDPATTAPVIHHNIELKTLEIRGAIAFQGDLDFHALELEVSYWPDKSDEAGIARLIVKEDKIPGRVGWKV
ncbi:hypothetical protein [Pseudomonas japonica]|uniref:Uncharacterized protein n=1 Tax=Pseudomonas japonica TaxID=256466 RepID=A0A239GWG8_9PSED|nr:hypothetical protein [Pseudomonas japonica]SNS73467.1 hypothetical protein SAMN05444352_1145 [Pseudomonas japonica]